jgi:hypothetical protein
MVAFALDWISFLSALKKEYGEPVDSGASFVGKSFSYLSSALHLIDGCNQCYGPDPYDLYVLDLYGSGSVSQTVWRIRDVYPGS